MAIRIVKMNRFGPFLQAIAKGMVEEQNVPVRPTKVKRSQQGMRMYLREDLPQQYLLKLLGVYQNDEKR
jgi:hypothetical protein